MNTRTKKIARLGIYLSLIILLSFVPLKIGPVNLAVLLLIPLFVGCQTEGFYSAFFLGLITGVFSLVASYTVSTSLLRFVFNNPLISVLPRVFVGIFTYLTYHGIKKALSKYDQKIQIMIGSTISTIVGVITNTTLVLGLMFAIYNGTTFGGIVINDTLIWAIVVSNSILELVISVFVTPSITYALYRQQNKHIF